MRYLTRRGSAAVEFALITPLLVVLLSAVMDFAKAFREWGVVCAAAHDATRIAVPRAADDPETIAHDHAMAMLAEYAFPCALSGTCDIDVIIDDGYLTTLVRVPFEPFVGLAPFPVQIGSSFTMLIEP